jgi:hypothetical protein
LFCGGETFSTKLKKKVLTKRQYKLFYYIAQKQTTNTKQANKLLATEMDSWRRPAR